jgi:thiol peroxidase
MGETDDDVGERHGEAFEFDEQLTIVGRQLVVGDVAPQFALASLDPATEEMRAVALADSAGTVRLLNVVNSLDTPVCHVETQRWEQLRGDLQPPACIYTISMDLPFAQARWRRAQGVEHESLSAHASEQFATDYGVLVKEWRLLQRAVFVIDAEGFIVHAEYVADQMTEPDYDAAIRAAAIAGTA